MAIDEYEATRRFGERDKDGKRPVMETIKARAEREKAMDEKQRAAEQFAENAKFMNSTH